jgi:para-nitrobenzyl esterase
MSADNNKMHQNLLGRRHLLKSGLIAGTAALTSLRGFAQDTRNTTASDVVNTTAGQVQGLRYTGGIKVFNGIPYGAPTSGANRFQKPAPVAGWTGVRDCSLIGNRCPQAPSGPGGPVTEVFSLDRKETMGEDCLSINVYTPAIDKQKRPVMVWLHGGGYSSGSASWLLYDGSNLAASQDVVVVTVNHRLNIFGHLYLKDLGGDAYADSGNVGMLDIVAVLEWVRDNIENFGGDPGSVTIFGQSGGAGKVSTLLGMPAAKGLFHKAIAMSGSALTSIPAAAATATAEKALAALGIDANNLEALQQLTTQQLLDAYVNTPGLNMGPVVDGSNLPGNVFNPAAPSMSASVPLMMGSTEHEVNFMPGTPLNPIDDAALQQQIQQLLGGDEQRARDLIALYKSGRPSASNIELYQIVASDNSFRRGVLTQAGLKADQKEAPVFLYYFTWQSPVRDGLLRAYHCLDIPFAFNNVDVCSAMTGAGQDRYALASRMSTAFANFARSGNPSHAGLPAWSAYNRQQKATMVMGNNPELVNDPYGKELQALYL